MNSPVMTSGTGQYLLTFDHVKNGRFFVPHPYADRSGHERVPRMYIALDDKDLPQSRRHDGESYQLFFVNYVEHFHERKSVIWLQERDDVDGDDLVAEVNPNIFVPAGADLCLVDLATNKRTDMTPILSVPASCDPKPVGDRTPILKIPSEGRRKGRRGGNRFRTR